MADLTQVYTGRYAEEYDKNRNKQKNWHIEQAIVSEELANTDEGERVLDIAAGTGRWIDALKRRRVHATLIDVSDDMLRVARDRAAAADFPITTIVGNALTIESLPPSDWLVSTRFFNWIPLEEVERILEKAIAAGVGRFVFSIRYRKSGRGRFGWLRSWRRIRSAVRTTLGFGRKATYHLHEEERVRAMLARVGLSIVKESVIVEDPDRRKVCMTAVLDRPG